MKKATRTWTEWVALDFRPSDLVRFIEDHGTAARITTKRKFMSYGSRCAPKKFRVTITVEEVER